MPSIIQVPPLVCYKLTLRHKYIHTYMEVPHTCMHACIQAPPLVGYKLTLRHGLDPAYIHTYKHTYRCGFTDSQAEEV